MAFIFVLSICWLLFWGVKVQRKNDIQTRKTEKNNILRIVRAEECFKCVPEYSLY
jgi:hypothetical protein